MKIAWNKNLTLSDSRIAKAVEKSTETIKKQFQNGRVVWNKGLTKELDARVKKYSETQKKKRLKPETIQKIKVARAKQIITEEHRKNIGLGVKKSKKYREALKIRRVVSNSGQFKKGSISPFKNKGVPLETRKKISCSLRKINLKDFEDFSNNLNFRIRNSKEYFIWRNKVFERDNYICQKCKTKNGMGKRVFLHAHHIKPFAIYPELRFEVSNGMTYCNLCHLKMEGKK